MPENSNDKVAEGAKKTRKRNSAKKPEVDAPEGKADVKEVTGPLSDVEFMQLAKDGKALPSEMTPTQKAWLQRYMASSAGKARPAAPDDQDDQAAGQEGATGQAGTAGDDVLEGSGDPPEVSETGVLPARDVAVPPFGETFVDDGAEQAEGQDDEQPMRLPPFEIPSMRQQDRSQSQPPSASPPHRLPNDLGLHVSEDDDCFHHNRSWKGGCCTIQGQRACAFQGGNQKNCTLYKDMETGRAESRRGRF